MEPLKSSGLDELGVIFYQTYWKVIGEDVSSTVLDFLNGDTYLSYTNHTYIALIAKVSNLESINEFRITSLCNILYKIS